MVDESTGSDTQASWHALKLICALALVKRKDSRPLFFPRANRLGRRLLAPKLKSRLKPFSP